MYYSVQQMAAKCFLTMDYGGNLRSNIAEVGQMRTSAEWHHLLLVSNAGTFRHVSAMGTCTLGIRILHC